MDNEWISVKDRLPKAEGKYLVVIEDMRHRSLEIVGFAFKGETVNEYDLGGLKNVWYDYDSHWGYYFYNSVTHWRCLPELPE